jgi:hypothetical protein
MYATCCQASSHPPHNFTQIPVGRPTTEPDSPTKELV